MQRTLKTNIKQAHDICAPKLFSEVVAIVVVSAVVVVFVAVDAAVVIIVAAVVFVVHQTESWPSHKNQTTPFAAVSSKAEGGIRRVSNQCLPPINHHNRRSCLRLILLLL